MIASLNGLVQFKSPSVAVLDVNGVGYEVCISVRTFDALPEVGEACFLFVQTVVREDAILLYGFSQREEKTLFLLLVSVSGIGPKLALTILSGIGASALCQVIASKDVNQLTTIPGVGKKTAQRVCMELGEKIGSLDDILVTPMPSGGALSPGSFNAMDDAISALVNLGYPQVVARQALQMAEQKAGEAAATMRVEEWIRQALQFLAARG